MTTTDPSPSHLTDLVTRLERDYAGRATHEDVVVCVRNAWDAVCFMGAADDGDMRALASRIAERDLRLRLGIDREAARLDPENHHR